MDKDTDYPGRWKPINFGWKYLNYVIIGVGLVVGFCVWILPNQWASPEAQAGLKAAIERERQIKEWNRIEALNKAEEERVARENEEMGLIYITPGTNPFLPPDQQPKPPAKPPAGQ
jgi:hypothetical protein